MGGDICSGSVRHPAWLAFGATVVVRALVAVSRLDELGLELYGGSIARALLEGMPLDLANLPIIPHLRGSVVAGVLLVPFFAVLGPTLLAIKCLAVLISGVTAALFAAFLARAAGRTAALAGGLLYALMPPAFQMVDVQLLGSHCEVIAVVLLAAWCARAARPDGPGAARRGALLGTACGFGVFFSLQFVVALPAVLALWLLTWRPSAPRPRAWLPAAVAWAAALAPWYFVTRLFIPADVGSSVIATKSIGQRFLPDGPGGALAKAADTLGHELRLSWLFEEHGGAWLGWIWFAALLLGLALCAGRLRRLEPVATFFALWAAAVMAGYVLTDFQLNLGATLDGVGSRYLMPVLACGVGLFAIGLEDLARRPRAGPRWAALLTAPPALAGAVGALLLVDLAVLRQPRARGTEFEYFHGQIEYAAGADPAARLAWIDRVDPDWPALRTLSYSIVHPRRKDLSTPEAFRAGLVEARAADGQLPRYLLGWLGQSAEKQATFELGLETLQAAAEPDELAWYVRGAAKQWLNQTGAKGQRNIKRGIRRGIRSAEAFQTIRELPPELRVPAAEGAGFHLGCRVRPYQRTLMDVLTKADEALPSELHEPFFRAVGWGYRRRFVEQGYQPPIGLKVEDVLDPGARDAFRRGLADPPDPWSAAQPAQDSQSDASSAPAKLAGDVDKR